jgi:hypothetical protein
MLNKNHLKDVNINELLKNLEITINKKYEINVKIINKEMKQLYDINEIYNNMNISSVVEINNDLLELNNKSYNNISLEGKRLKDIEKLIKTTMIGSVAKIENVFGPFWGHGKKQDERTEKQQRLYELFMELQEKLKN